MDSSTMSTRDLARALGQIESLRIAHRSTSRISQQPFHYLFVLDFEATCWDIKDKQKWHKSEVIEFPVILYDVDNETIVSQFHEYVKPTENTILSSFCTELTGIHQYQVQHAVTLHTCLSMFDVWVQKQLEEYKLTFNEETAYRKKSAFVTWSRWDLGTCLKKECKRKGFDKNKMFNKWIDLREIYKEFYSRNPKGLNGALTEVGLVFKGREHCGLDDAKNTAFLAARMIAEGAYLRITEELP